MNMIRLYTGKDGQTHIEELDLATHPELTTMQATKGIVFRTTKRGHTTRVVGDQPRLSVTIPLAD